jgi:trehalose 6-phosphate synthase
VNLRGAPRLVEARPRGRQSRIGAFPVSIETATYARLARNAARSPLATEITESLNGLRLVLGVDRPDYSKGIIQRINAFDRFLEVNREWRSRVTLLQITPKSRSDIKDYAAIENELTTLIGKVNGRYGEASLTPIRPGVPCDLSSTRSGHQAP